MGGQPLFVCRSAFLRCLCEPRYSKYLARYMYHSTNPAFCVFGFFIVLSPDVVACIPVRESGSPVAYCSLVHVSSVTVFMERPNRIS